MADGGKFVLEIALHARFPFLLMCYFSLFLLESGASLMDWRFGMMNEYGRVGGGVMEAIWGQHWHSWWKGPWSKQAGRRRLWQRPVAWSPCHTTDHLFFSRRMAESETPRNNSRLISDLTCRDTEESDTAAADFSKFASASAWWMAAALLFSFVFRQTCFQLHRQAA